MKALIFWTVALSLVSVLVGNYLSFHIDSDDIPKISAHNSQILKSKLDSTQEHNFDPCNQGHCHLGHCAVVLLPLSSEAIDRLAYLIVYSSKEFFFISRFLEGPFQPPRLV
ncbi:hypothetical protein [Bdellovibrio sp. ZAP7]|uniref:hypothetical protein n=1 Tax=Bdellovibrio sp. ZAP7 TaxID=2231053 RepID=UPI00115B4022|nr:hypothetical protein [Bdellovibrio sp. ZAP7]